MIRKKWYLILIAVVAIGGIFLFTRGKVIEVTEVKVDNKIIKKTVSASGKVISNNDVNLSFSGFGKITDISIKEGENVTTNQYVAMIDAYADSQSAKAYKDARDIAIRNKEMFIKQYSSNVSAAGGEDEYYMELRKYDELISQAQATYNSQLASVGTKYIYSPIEGTVIDTFKEEGEIASPGETIVKIADVDNLLFEIEIDQEDYGYLSVGQNVEIALDAYDGEKFLGVVEALPQYVDAGNGSDFIVKIKFSGENKDKVLLGMNGDAYIILASSEKEVPSLTFDDIYYDIEDKPFLYVSDNNKVKKEYIEIGLQGDIFTEIKTIPTNKIVKVSDTKNELKEGIKVRIINN